MERRTRKRIGEILIAQEVITEEQLIAALESQLDTPGVRVGRIMIEKGFTTENAIAEALANHLNLPYENMDQYIMDPETLRMIPVDLALRHRVIPLFRVKERLVVAMSDPLDVFAMDAIRELTGLKLDLVVTTATELENALRRHYGASMNSVVEEMEEDVEVAEDTKDSGIVDVTQMESAAEEAPIIRLLNSIFSQAIRDRASDIHVEPDERVLHIRFRVDGILRVIKGPPISFHAPLVSRIKLIAGLDIAERRIPQDGRVRIKVQGHNVDLRVSVLPTVFGEKAVIRVLDLRATRLGLDDLGLESRDVERLKSILAAPNGILLVTGPTGSGKTTTLYSCLQHLNSEEVNIVTVEDPVEYHIERVNQVQVLSKAGLTFASILKSILRQDPDIVMVGEIRDKETAEIAIQAALTGHFVLSTLHTNDAPLTVTRLVQMGVEPFLVASSLTGIVAQRLIRKICENCRQSETVTRVLADRLEIPIDSKVSRGRGCKQCGETGYEGRIGLFEVMTVDEKLQELIIAGASAHDLRRAGCAAGMRSLRQTGIEKILAGETTIEEVLRVSQDHR